MNQQRSQQLIVGCLAASAAVAAGSSLAEGQAPGMRMVVGVAFTGVGLATVSMLGAPDLAGALSVLILTSTVFLYGRPLFDLITDTTDPEPARTTRRPTRPHTPKVVSI